MADLVAEIKKSGIIQYGSFDLRSGSKSNIYFDFKALINNKNLFAKVCRALADICCDNVLVIGVPVGGIPYATLVAHFTQQPLAIVRVEEKKHGTKKKIEVLQKCKCLEVVIIEDVITTGNSVLEIAKILEENGYKIKLVLCILHISGSIKYPIKSLFKPDDFKDLKAISNVKKTRLIAALDLNDGRKILEILEKIGPQICAVKLHFDIIDHPDSFIEKILLLKKKYNFLIIEDRKYCDIPVTCIAQLKRARVNEWADIVTATGLFGVELIREIAKTGLKIILIHQTSSGDAFPEYSARVAKMAATEESVIGVFSENCKKSEIGGKLIFNSDFIIDDMKSMITYSKL